MEPFPLHVVVSLCYSIEKLKEIFKTALSEGGKGDAALECSREDLQTTIRGAVRKAVFGSSSAGPAAPGATAGAGTTQESKQGGAAAASTSGGGSFGDSSLEMWPLWGGSAAKSEENIDVIGGAANEADEATKGDSSAGPLPSDDLPLVDGGCRPTTTTTTTGGAEEHTGASHRDDALHQAPVMSGPRSASALQAPVEKTPAPRVQTPPMRKPDSIIPTVDHVRVSTTRPNKPAGVSALEWFGWPSSSTPAEPEKKDDMSEADRKEEENLLASMSPDVHLRLDEAVDVMVAKYLWPAGEVRFVFTVRKLLRSSSFTFTNE